MSVSKRRAQKSINQSNLSSISNSQNMRDSSMFKNYALIEIQNISSHNQSKSSRKSQVQENSIKKVIAKRQPLDVRTKSKENQKSKQNRATINYSGISKIVEEKNILINTQQRQIQGLKGTLERVRKQLELTRIEFDRKKMEDLSSLKKQQQDNEENIKELEILRVGMRQLKNKIESLEIEKAHLSKKSHEYLGENQELTIKLATLKQEYNTNISTQQTIKMLTHELAILKQQQKQTKELQVQKVTQDERCRTLERKINEYILRYNQIQSDYNQIQIKYYRAQKDNDDLKMQIEQLEMENKKGRKMLEEEKSMTNEMMEKWKSRIIRLEDLHKSERKYQPAAEIEERCTKLQQAEVEVQMQEKIAEISKLNISIGKLTEQLKDVKYEMGRVGEENSHLRERLSGVCEQANKDRQVLEKQVRDLGMSTATTSANERQNKQKISCLQKQISICTHQIAMLEEELAQNHEYINSLELQLETFSNSTQNYQDISEAHMHQLHMWKEQSSRLQAALAHTLNQCEQLEQSVRQKNVEVEQLKSANSKLSEDVRQVGGLLKIKNAQIDEQELNYSHALEQQYNLRSQLSGKDEQISALTLQLQSVTADLASLQSHLQISQASLHTAESSLMQKLQILQHNIKQLTMKNYEQSQLVEAKNSEISRLEGIIGGTNGELKEIKAIVHSYKQQIEECNQAIAEADRKYENQLYLGKEAELKWQEEIGYYKLKYEENFKQNIQVTTSMRELQQQLVDQANKCTELVKTIASLESQVQKTNENKSILELATNCEIDHANAELNKMKMELTNSQLLKSQLSTQLREAQSRIVDSQNQLVAARAESAKVRQENEQLSIANMKLKQQYAMGTYELMRAKEDNNRINCISSALKQQHNRIIGQLKAQHQQQFDQFSKKLQEQKKTEIELQQLRWEKVQRSYTEKQQALTEQLQKALRELEEKNNQIERNNEAIQQKEGQLEDMQKQRAAQENEELRKIKEQNYILVQQAEEASEQLNKNYHELREMTEQCQKYRTNINLLEREVNGLQNRNIELGNEVNGLKCMAYQQSEEYGRVISQFRCQLGASEQKLKCQSQQISHWIQKYESGEREVKRMQMECSKVSRNYLEESNRKSKQNSRELENYRSQIQLLQEENFNLQRIMDKELGKRKAIIEELIHEKKLLYEQMGRN